MTINRSAPPKRRTPPKKVNRKRKAKAFARAYGGRDRLAFVKSLPCIAGNSRGTCAGEIHCHHIEVGGAGLKAPADKTVPLCSLHHLILHNEGRQTFELAYGVNLQDEARATELRWKIASDMRSQLEQLPHDLEAK
jgi:hypothetical protein